MCWLHLFSLQTCLWYIRGAHYTMDFDGWFSKVSFLSAKKPTQHFLHYEIFFKKKYIWQLNLTSSFSKKVGFPISTLCNLYETEPAYQFTNYLSTFIFGCVISNELLYELPEHGNHFDLLWQIEFYDWLLILLYFDLLIPPTAKSRKWN